MGICVTFGIMSITLTNVNILLESPFPLQNAILGELLLALHGVQH